MRLSLLRLFGAALLAAPAAAQNQVESPGSAPVARAARVGTAPMVDGRLDDSVWAGAPVIGGFVQHEPFDGQPATETTEVRILFDREALYLGAWLFDRDPSGIVVGESRRDVDLTNLDAFIVVLDTYRDRQNAFVFGTSPAGVEYDGQVTREGESGFGVTISQRQQTTTSGGINVNWDGNWTVVTSQDERGWYAEFRIPFSTLRYPGSGEQVWGLNLSRHIRRKNEQDFWTPIPRQYSLYRVSLAGTLEGVAPPARRVASISPYVLSSARRDYDLDDGTVELEVGGDAKLGVTQSLTLDLTYNTDFAQVEVDDQQVNLTRFPLFFPEKRPFFLENAGNFAVGTPQTLELFFSRRIGIGPDGGEVPLIGGARLTGKVGGLNLGVLDLQADDRDSIATANFGVVRVYKEIARRSRVGAIFVSRLNTDSTADYNLTYGLDGRLALGTQVLVDAYAAKTQTPGLTGDDRAFNLSGAYTDRNWEMGLAYRAVGADFNPEVGFVTRSDSRYTSARILRHIRTPGISWFRELRPHITYFEYFDREWFTETRLLHIDNHFQFANGAFFQLPAVNLTREGLKEPFEIADGVVVPPGSYDNVEWGFAYNTDLSAPVSIQGRLNIGGFYSGRRINWTPTFNLRTGPFVSALRLDVTDAHLREGDFTTALIGLKVAWSFTPRMYIQSLVQWSNQTDALQGNFRFGWLSAAGTGLFLVYNDIERTQEDRGPQHRAFIVKFTKLIGLN